MSRIDIYNRMKELGMKHYIISAIMHSNDDKRVIVQTDGFNKCHFTHESFDKEVDGLLNKGYDQFDVIHLHE